MKVVSKPIRIREGRETEEPRIPSKLLEGGFSYWDLAHQYKNMLNFFDTFPLSEAKKETSLKVNGEFRFILKERIVHPKELLPNYPDLMKRLEELKKRAHQRPSKKEKREIMEGVAEIIKELQEQEDVNIRRSFNVLCELIEVNRYTYYRVFRPASTFLYNEELAKLKVMAYGKVGKNLRPNLKVIGEDYENIHVSHDEYPYVSLPKKTFKNTKIGNEDIAKFVAFVSFHCEAEVRPHTYKLSYETARLSNFAYYLNLASLAKKIYGKYPTLIYRLNPPYSRLPDFFTKPPKNPSRALRLNFESKLLLSLLIDELGHKIVEKGEIAKRILLTPPKEIQEEITNIKEFRRAALETIISGKFGICKSAKYIILGFPILKEYVEWFGNMLEEEGVRFYEFYRKPPKNQIAHTNEIKISMGQWEKLFNAIKPESPDLVIKCAYALLTREKPPEDFFECLRKYEEVREKKEFEEKYKWIEEHVERVLPYS